jgi:hypothetical protein
MREFEESVNEYWNPFHNWSDDQTQHQHQMLWLPPAERQEASSKMIKN